MAERKATVEEIKRIQEALSHRGLYVGPIDGIAGPGTLAAIRNLQTDMGVDATGVLATAELIELGLFKPPAPKPAPKSNPITSFLVRKGVEIVVSNLLKGNPMLNVLSGFKTYILAALIILCALAETFLGVDIPEFNMGLGEAIAVGLALITGRAGAKADVKALK